MGEKSSSEIYALYPAELHARKRDRIRTCDLVRTREVTELYATHAVSNHSGINDCGVFHQKK